MKFSLFSLIEYGLKKKQMKEREEEVLKKICRNLFYRGNLIFAFFPLWNEVPGIVLDSQKSPKTEV